MNKKAKTFIYQLISFSIVFIPFRLGISYFTELEGFWPAFLSFLATLLLAPKFQVVSSNKETKIMMKSIFSKEVKEVN